MTPSTFGRQPAFPNTAQGTMTGLTLRDYLAAQALVGLLAAPVPPGGGQLESRLAALQAYEYADAMLLMAVGPFTGDTWEGSRPRQG